MSRKRFTEFSLHTLYTTFMTERPKPTTPAARAAKLEQALKEVRAQKAREEKKSSRGPLKAKPSTIASDGTARAEGTAAPKGSKPAFRAGSKRLDLPEAPPPNTLFYDLEGQGHTFPDSPFKRLAAELLSRHKKRWKYRPFGFPLMMPSNREHDLYFDFYVFDNMNTLVKLITLSPRDSREIWDRVGRFKQQYSMYSQEVWTPQILAELLKKRTLKF